MRLIYFHENKLISYVATRLNRMCKRLCDVCFKNLLLILWYNVQTKTFLYKSLQMFHYYFALIKTCSWSLGKIRIVDKKLSICILQHEIPTQVKMYFCLFFPVLFHHSFPLEYAFTCQIFVRCSDTWNFL